MGYRAKKANEREQTGRRKGKGWGREEGVAPTSDL